MWPGLRGVARCFGKVPYLRASRLACQSMYEHRFGTSLAFFLEPLHLVSEEAAGASRQFTKRRLVSLLSAIGIFIISAFLDITGSEACGPKCPGAMSACRTDSLRMSQLLLNWKRV